MDEDYRSRVDLFLLPSLEPALQPDVSQNPRCSVGFMCRVECRVHSGQTAGHSREHARDLSTSGQFPSSSHKIPRSTSATRAISVLSSITLLLQTFFSRVLLLRQQPFSSENLPPERPTTTIAIKTQVFMFRYESVNSTRKFTIVAEIVSLLKKIYKRDVPFRAVFKVKTLAVLFLAYPREMKHIPRNLNLPPFCRCLFLWKWCNPFPRERARLKHAHSFDRCGSVGCSVGCSVKVQCSPAVLSVCDAA